MGDEGDARIYSGLQASELRAVLVQRDSEIRELRKLSIGGEHTTLGLANRVREQDDVIQQLRSLVDESLRVKDETYIHGAQVFLDPMVNEEVKAMRRAARESDRLVSDAKLKLAAATFSPDSKHGEALVGHLRSLKEENKELSELATEAKARQYQDQIRLLETELAAKRAEMDAFADSEAQLAAENERLAERLRELELRLESAEAREEDKGREPEPQKSPERGSERSRRPRSRSARRERSSSRRGEQGGDRRSRGADSRMEGGDGAGTGRGSSSRRKERSERKRDRSRSRDRGRRGSRASRDRDAAGRDRRK